MKCYSKQEFLYIFLIIFYYAYHDITRLNIYFEIREKVNWTNKKKERDFLHKIFYKKQSYHLYI